MKSGLLVFSGMVAAEIIRRPGEHPIALILLAISTVFACRIIDWLEKAE